MKTAVLVCGYLRTWHLCKDELVKAMNHIYGDDIDWFMAVWKSGTDSEQGIRDFFAENNQNLINLQYIDFADNILFHEQDELVDDQWVYTSPSILGPTYLRQQASYQKKLHEFKNDKTYDRVVFSRTDVIYYYNKETIQESEKIHLGDHDDFAMQLRGDFDDTAFEIGSPSAHDVFPIAGRLSSDLYGLMYLDANNTYNAMKRINLRQGCAHAWLSNYCSRHLISVDFRWLIDRPERDIWAKVIRPTVKDIAKIKEEHDTWNGEFFFPNDDPMWNNDPDSYYKIKFCQELLIDLDDYDLEKFRTVK